MSEEHKKRLRNICLLAYPLFLGVLAVSVILGGVDPIGVAFLAVVGVPAFLLLTYFSWSWLEGLQQEKKMQEESDKDADST